MEFVPIDYDYFDFEGRNYIRMIGRNSKGEKVCVIDSYEPNFWVILKDEKKATIDKVKKKLADLKIEKAGRISEVLRVEVADKKYLGEDVKALRVFITNHKDAHEFTSEIGDMTEIVARREHDIPLITKYIKEKGIEPLKRYSVEARALALEDFGGIVDALELKDCVYAEEMKVLPDKAFEPRILAYDIETDGVELGKGEILMVSLYGKDFKKVLTWKKCESAGDYVECFKDEGEMIEKFVEYVNEYDPDILTGYFSDGFDLPYLKASAQKHKVKLGLGVDGKGPSFSRGRIPSGKILGIVHVDLFRFIDAVFSQYLQSETLSLNEVAGELVGERKEDFDFRKLPHMQDKDWSDFFSYNLQDAAVTYKLAMKIWPDISEFCKIIKEPVFDVTRDRMSAHVENHIIHNLDRFDEIVERRPGYDETNERKNKGKFEGAFVYEPKPGLYTDLVMFDFTSMHASIIVSFNVSKSTLREGGTAGCHESPEFDLDGEKKKVCFTKESGFFSTLLSEVVDKRKQYKKEYNANKNAMTKARSNAYKLLANASFGYQGFFGARYYSREAAAATLAFVRKFNHDTMAKVEKAGHEVIYGDTDSICLLSEGKSKKDILKFLEEINGDLPGIMELDLEDLYPRGLFVAKRGSKEGAKKKYALIDEDERIKIRGFETVRRDWCKLTRNLQSEVLKKILKSGDEKVALKLLKDVLKDLRERKVELGQLMIKTQLRRPINEYRAEGPHVIAAKKMEKEGIPVSPGMLIEYYIGENPSGGKLVRDRVFLPDEKAKYDIEYYLKNQILPAVENIFDVFDVDVSAVADGESQTKLF